MKLHLLLPLISTIALAGDPDFDTYWRNGKAELDGYRLAVSRYGQERKGQAVLIYVTEPFSETKRVKVDDPGKNPADTFDAFKLNIVRDFQTGIYDYNTMVSVFVRSADFSPVKITFSSAEWCGHVFEELLFHPGKITSQYYSYFEGETGKRDFDWPKDGVTEDSLWILLRGLHGEFLSDGKKTTHPFLPGVFYSRLAHIAPAWTSAEIEHLLMKPQMTEVPAGKFYCLIYTVKTRDGRNGEFWVEQAPPYRIVRWKLLPDVKAELTGSLRVPYWQLHNNGDEKYLKELGLEPTVK